MDRFTRFAATGADLAWRIKNGAKSVPCKTLEVLPDGSELVVLHESDGMRARRRREAGNPAALRLPDTIARLVTFLIRTETRGGRVKTTRVRVLTTLLDHESFPARDIAELYAERWQIEIAFLHLKKDGPRSPPPAARPVPRICPPGSLGTAAHPQHHRHRIRPRRRIRRHRPRPHPVHRRARPRPLPRRRRHLLPALRPPPRQRGCPAGQPGRRDPHPAPPPSGPPADLRQDRNRTTNQAHRRSHLHHRHHKVESPEMGHNSGNLRAVGCALWPQLVGEFSQ